MAHLNLFNAPGYQHTFSTPSAYDAEPMRRSAKAIEVYSGEGTLYQAHAYGKYWPGGNPVFRGPLRATREEAEADVADPKRIIWRCIGYSF